jgi:alcohol dehydrogenase
VSWIRWAERRSKNLAEWLKAYFDLRSPDPDFAKKIGASWILRLAMRVLSHRIRKGAKRHHVSYSFLFMRPSGDQLHEIGSLIDSGAIRPVVDRVFPFESTKEALAYVEKGRAKGKVIVKVK